MENPNELNLLRRAELMAKHRHIIAKVAREKELEREKEIEREREMKREHELERIAKAKRVAAVREQNENDQAMRKRLGIRRQPRFSKTGRRVSPGAVNTLNSNSKTTVETADETSNFPLLLAAISELYGSRSIFEDGTGLQLVQETE